MSKLVASSLTSVLSDRTMQNILDRHQPVGELAEKMVEDWSLDLYTRKPGPAVNEHGEFQGTDLDLATFMTALSLRKAVIQIPNYGKMRAATKTEGVRHIQGTRNGNIMSMTSNKQVFSFGVKINDQSLVIRDPETGVETQGMPRNFSLMDVTGEWHEGWHTIQFSPSAKENDFLSNNNLWTGSQIVFKNFIHPNRWMSFFGNPYFKAKAMVARLDEESKFLRTEIERLKSLGITFPSSGTSKRVEWPKSEVVGETKPLKVSTMEVQLDLPERTGDYVTLPETQEALVEADKQYRYWVYNLGPTLRFATRCVEYAMFKHGFRNEEKTEEKMPGWISGATWERDYKLPKGRTKWNRLILFQPAVGERGVAIRYRIHEKTEQVAA